MSDIMIMFLLSSENAQSRMYQTAKKIFKVSSSDLTLTATKAAFYWAIQAGLLTPLTFAHLRLSPLVVFTSGAYFLHNGRR